MWLQCVYPSTLVVRIEGSLNFEQHMGQQGMRIGQPLVYRVKIAEKIKVNLNYKTALLIEILPLYHRITIL